VKRSQRRAIRRATRIRVAKLKSSIIGKSWFRSFYRDTVRADPSANINSMTSYVPIFLKLIV